MKRFYRLIAALLVPTLLLVLCPTAAAGRQTLKEGVSILNPRQNIHGVGYEWNNPDDTLTLTDLSIDTEDDYGLKLPDGATVILEGHSEIRAAVAALYMEGNVIFRGKGSLTLIGGEYGVLCNGSTAKKLSITGGTFTVTGGTDGIRSDSQAVAVSGGSITVTGESRYAINARELTTAGNVSIRASGAFHTSYRMALQAANLTITASDGPALRTDRYLTLDGMTLRAGNDLFSLKEIDSYLDEPALVTVSTFDGSRRSLLFGDKAPLLVDILILLAGVLLIAAAVSIPLLRRKRRAEAIIAARSEQEREEKKAKKKQNRA